MKKNMFVYLILLHPLHLNYKDYKPIFGIPDPYIYYFTFAGFLYRIKLHLILYNKSFHSLELGDNNCLKIENFGKIPICILYWLTLLKKNHGFQKIAFLVSICLKCN